MSADPTPLGLREAWALIAVAVRELIWVLPSVEREIRLWSRRAREIPSGPLRDDALITLKRERLNTEGAALFCALPPRRERTLLCLLVAYQILLDYLDTISEQPCEDPLANGRQLHLALTEALDPGGPVSDYYRYHRYDHDSGYLDALVRTCRDCCERLPGYVGVRSLAMREASRAAVQVLNHDPIPDRRDAALAAWAEREFPDSEDFYWFELTAAASSSLWIHALLALAAIPSVGTADIEEAGAAYFPWITAASTLLDAFVDQADDAATGNHSYVAHYPTPEVAAERLREIVFESASRARRLRRGTRHALITTGMVAMYLSKDSAREPALRDDARAILAAAGSLPRVQLPIMRIMRMLHGLRSA